MLRYLIVGSLACLVLAAPSSASFASKSAPEFKRLDYPLPARPGQDAALRPRFAKAQPSTFLAAASAEPLRKRQLGSVASLTQVSLLGDTVNLSAGTVRETSQIDREIDMALSGLKMGQSVNDFGQGRSAFVGLGYDSGGQARSGWNVNVAAGARLVDASFRGRLNETGEAWRGKRMDRYGVEPALSLKVGYRF